MAVIFIGSIEEERNCRSMPVIGMDDIRVEVEHLAELKSRLGEKDKTAVIIVKLDIIFIIKAVSTEIPLMLEKIDRHIGIRHRAFVNSTVFIAKNPHWHDQYAGEHFQTVFFPIDLVIARHNEPDIMAKSAQILRQRADNVRQSAALGKGNRFRSGDENFKRHWEAFGMQ